MRRRLHITLTSAPHCNGDRTKEDSGSWAYARALIRKVTCSSMHGKTGHDVGNCKAAMSDSPRLNRQSLSASPRGLHEGVALGAIRGMQLMVEEEVDVPRYLDKAESRNPAPFAVTSIRLRLRHGPLVLQLEL